MSKVENNKQIKLLSDEFIINKLIDNINKTDSTVTKFSLLLVVIMLGYLLVQFGATDNIAIGLITIKGNQIIKIITPILFGFILLKTHSYSMFLRELRAELKEKMQTDYNMPLEKVRMFSVLDFNEYITRVKNFSGVGLTYLIFMVLIFFTVNLAPVVFQIYIINNLFLIDFQPKILVEASQIISITLMLVLYGGLFTKVVDIFIEHFKEDENKLEYPKYTLTVFQTILSILFFMGFVIYVKVYLKEDSLSTFQAKALMIFFMTVVMISYYAFINSLRSFKEKISKGLKWVNIFMLLYNLLVLVLFLYLIIT